MCFLYIFINYSKIKGFKAYKMSPCALIFNDMSKRSQYFNKLYFITMGGNDVPKHDVLCDTSMTLLRR